MTLEEVKKYLFPERQFLRASWLHESFNKVIQLIDSTSILSVYYKNLVDEDKNPILYFFTENKIFYVEFNAQTKGVKLEMYKIQNIQKIAFNTGLQYQTELIIEIINSEPIKLNSNDVNADWIGIYSDDILKIGGMLISCIK